MLWFLFVLVGLALFGIAVWDYRRKAARRDEATRDRFEHMFNLKAAAASVPAVAPVGATAVAMPAAAAPPLAATERMLSAPETLVFFLLKTAIPDHEIFPKAPLGALVRGTGTGYAAEQQARRLMHHYVDFAVCDRRTRVVAVVELGSAAGGAEAAEARRYRAACLKEAGIRLVSFDTGALPARDQIRKLVCG